MTTPKNKRLPKARVFVTRNVNATTATPKEQRQNYTAVIPCPTAAKARQIVKAAPFLTMTEEEQVDLIADALQLNEDAGVAVLAAINGGGK